MPSADETLDGSLPGLDNASSETLPGESSGKTPAETLPGESSVNAETLAPETSDVGASNADAFPITQWDRYTFVRLLGKGGMGAVYEARDNRLDRNVALKFIRGGDPELTMRLAREARAQARIEHDNVCKVYEVSEIQGKAYIAMQLVEGETLDKAAAHMSLDEKVIVMRDIARALHAAHTLGILHRDIKPSNILVEVTTDGQNKPIVMDFGLARDEGANRGMTETGMVVGTPAYMSPEQARGERHIDRRADVYSLGATLYELLCGRPPFTGDSPMNIVISVLSEDPVPLRTRIPSLPPDLSTIAAKCLHKDANERYESARALAEDLDRFILGEPILGRRESTYRRLRRWAAKHRALVTITTLALVAVGFAGAVAIQGQIRAAREKAELQAQAIVEQELAQDIKEMEWFLRTAHMMPLHDVTRERAIVKERMKRIDERRAAGGRIAALVDYAVGRGHLALGEDEKAHERLSQALREGMDGPELHYALGLVLGRRYQQALVRLRGAGDAHWARQEIKKIEAEYLIPALTSMGKSRGVRLEAPSYLEGLIAFYRKDYPEALRLARQAQTEAPWFYEAIALQAETQLALGNAHKARGQPEEAKRSLDEAGRLFDSAADIGRSDGWLHEGGAEARIRTMELNSRSNASLAGDLAIAIERTERAARTRPDRGEPYVKKAFAYSFIAQHYAWSGQDPRPYATLMIDAALGARTIDGDSAVIHERLAAAHSYVSRYERTHGMDARASNGRTMEHAERATQLDPTHPWNWIMLEIAQNGAGALLASAGEDPTAYYQKAISSARKAAEIEEGFGYGFVNALNACQLWAGWLVNRGRHPSRETAAMCGAIFEPCVRANPRAHCQQNQGVFDYYEAAYLMDAGEDPGPAILRTQANLETANSIYKDILENRQLFTALRLLQARLAFQRGEDTTAALDAFRAMLADCFRLDAKDPMCTLLDARRVLLEADIEAKNQRPEKPALEKALKLAALAIERDAREPDAHQVLAEVYRRLAVVGSEQDKYCKAGLDACAKGLSINPNHPRLLLTCGGLHLVDAKSADDKASPARRALESLEKAAQLNPLLRREADPLLAEAKRLSGGNEASR